VKRKVHIDVASSELAPTLLIKDLSIKGQY